MRFFYEERMLLFSVTDTDSYGILHLALSLVCMASPVASIWAITRFSRSLFGVCLSANS